MQGTQSDACLQRKLPQCMRDCSSRVNETICSAAYSAFMCRQHDFTAQPALTFSVARMGTTIEDGTWLPARRNHFHRQGSCAIGDMFSWRDLTWKPSMFGDSTCPCLFCMSLTQGEVSPATARGQPGCSELEPSRRMVRETRPAKQLRPLMHWSGHGTWPCFRFVRELTVVQFLYRLQQQCWAPESDNCVRDKYMSASIPLPCVMDFHTL